MFKKVSLVACATQIQLGLICRWFSFYSPILYFLFLATFHYGFFFKGLSDGSLSCIMLYCSLP